MKGCGVVTKLLRAARAAQRDSSNQANRPDDFVAGQAGWATKMHKFVAQPHFSIYDKGHIVLGYGPSLTTQQRQHARLSPH
jgi:hypothetical protein